MYQVYNARLIDCECHCTMIVFLTIVLTFCNWKFTIFIWNRIYVIVIVSIVHGTLYACSSFSQPLQPPEPSPPKVHRVSYRGKGGYPPLAPISPPFNNDWVSIAGYWPFFSNIFWLLFSFPPSTSKSCMTPWYSTEIAVPINILMFIRHLLLLFAASRAQRDAGSVCLLHWVTLHPTAG